ncbi:MAG TPA: CAP domain-containing protein [Candidatus Saccharimonadales bacterium]|nr:CAP domain-containing protein [Candidatus Saccharimonadales bacterium]
MTAKIKTHPRYESKRGHSSKPKGVDSKTFNKVYWPFIPVLVAFSLLLSVAVRTVPLNHPGGHVLAYQTSRSVAELLKDTNLQRQKDGEKPLTLDDQLNEAAQAKADDMTKRDYWSHYTPEGVAPWSFVSSTGYVYQTVGENLAAGFRDDDAVVNAWMASPHHRENMLNKDYTQVGFAYADNPNYTAAGGGPMTVVVAYYAQPVVIGTGATAAGALTPPTTLSSATTRLASGISSSAIATWAPAILALGGAAAIILFFEKHRRYFMTAAAEGERYILRHPATDIGLILIIGLVLLLAQTAGHIL